MYWAAAEVAPGTQSEIAFNRESVARPDDLDTARKNRITGTNSEIPDELWILLLGDGVVMLICALEHPFVGSLSSTGGRSPPRRVEIPRETEGAAASSGASAQLVQCRGRGGFKSVSREGWTRFGSPGIFG
jgi:hypothetical protein